MASRPLVLVHGYADRGASFRRWVEALQQRGYDVRDIRVSSYQSLTNELTIKDIAEGLERALRVTAGLEADEPFDAIVHSTGGLVIRAWLTAYQGRVDRLKHLIMLAPANFGSPMAHKGRSWLGALFKGGKELGPDFLEAGDRILAGLELGSPFTWELAHQDLVGPETYYGPSKKTPFAFVFIGTSHYGWLRRAFSEPGTDGTVRWAGSALNSRKITLDLTRDPARPENVDRIRVGGWSNADMPLVLVEGVNHGTILSDPPESLVALVDSALHVSSQRELEAWRGRSTRITAASGATRWQQFVVRAMDERGDPIGDYYLDFYTRGPRGRERRIEEISADVHTYRDDPSFRCFHVDLDDLEPERLTSLFMRVRASSGTEFVAYHGFGSHGPPVRAGAASGPEQPGGRPGDQLWDAEVDLTDLLRQRSDPRTHSASFFHPFTTTLVEVRLNREPMPLTGRNRVLRLDAAGELWTDLGPLA
jgi:pimeloyl-ACP methyl ester carboxylesterase